MNAKVRGPVSVKISGPVYSGKTNLMYQIQALLEKEGARVRCRDEVDERTSKGRTPPPREDLKEYPLSSMDVEILVIRA